MVVEFIPARSGNFLHVDELLYFFERESKAFGCKNV